MSESRRQRVSLGALLALLVVLSGAGLWALRQSAAGASEWAETVFSVASTLTIAGGVLMWWWSTAGATASEPASVSSMPPSAATRPAAAPRAEDAPDEDDLPPLYAEDRDPVALNESPATASLGAVAATLSEVSTREVLTPTSRSGSSGQVSAALPQNAWMNSAVNAAQRGGEVVVQVVQNLEDISASSRRINEIVATIDSIAFQTNILALNAAVQAARARQQGGGSASVAAEVRNLAQRAASAAKEIRTLVNQSADKVESGNRMVRDAGATMEAIVGSVQSVTEIIGRLGSAGETDPKTVQDVGASVEKLDRLAGQHTQLIEQSASAADALRQQADRLQKVVSAFRLLQQTQEAAWTAHNAISGARSSSRFGALSDDRGRRQGSDGGRDPSVPGDWEKF